jgi:hypothetical protein
MTIPTWWGRASMKTVPAPPDRNSKARESREDFVRRDLTRRLKDVCEKLSPAEFDALVLKMTREQLRGEGILPTRT